MDLFLRTSSDPDAISCQYNAVIPAINQIWTQNTSDDQGTPQFISQGLILQPVGLYADNTARFLPRCTTLIHAS